MLVLFKFQALRDTPCYVTISALALADFLEGFATAFGGLYRNIMLWMVNICDVKLTMTE